MRRLSEVCNLVSKDVEILRDCSFDDLYLVGKPYPYGKKTISFLGSEKFTQDFLNYNIDGVICTKEIANTLFPIYSGGIAITNEPKTVFFMIHNYYAERKEQSVNNIASTAIIHSTAIIENHDIEIGERSVIMANTVVKAGSRIGNDCIVGEGCVIGAPAFYYFGTGSNKKMVISSGTVDIGNNVDLHTNVTIEKSVLGGSTKIGDNTKIDNLCLIGHDSVIDENVTIAGKSILAGGVELGKDCFLGVGVTIAPYVKCGIQTKISSGAVVTKDVPDNMHVSGNFAIPHDRFIKHIKSL